MLAIISGLLSNQIGFMVKRCSNVFTAMMLMSVGQYLFQTAKLKFDNGKIAVIATVLLYEISVASGGVDLNDNAFSDMAVLICGALSALYILGYLGRRYEGCFIERFVRYCGKESFYIMALHFVGFKIATIILTALGLPHCDIAKLTPDVGNNFFLVIMYFSIGLLFPLSIVALYRKTKYYLVKFYDNHFNSYIQNKG